ncbi:MAG: acetolactate decarboxylase [Polaromonas sp.]|nr:acetolactate decarboxylase [Polaromonas sp.]
MINTRWGLAQKSSRPSWRTALLFSLAVALAGCTSVKPKEADQPALYVYSTIDALLSGAYDGELTVKRLVSKGDFGLGTYNRLDGEMLVLGGVPYHFKADGSVTVARPDDKIPLAYVLPFRPTQRFTLAGAPTAMSLTDIEAAIDARLPNKNLFYAVDVTGQFTGITTRAIAAQVRPYRPLAELVKTQVLFPKVSASGTMVGIRSPAFSKGVSVPGWHWHFISDDRSYGGHVLAIGLVNAVASVTPSHKVDLDLPANEDFANSDQTKDRSVELHQVEKQQK